MVTLPNWRDPLGFSGGGDLGQMRRAQAWLEEGTRRGHPNLDELQVVLVSELGLVVPDDPVLALWESVRATDPDIDFIDDADGGVPWGSLFHEWTIERLMRRGSGRGRRRWYGRRAARPPSASCPSAPGRA